mgnify:CR=1 FL=1
MHNILILKISQTTPTVNSSATRDLVLNDKKTTLLGPGLNLPIKIPKNYNIITQTSKTGAKS